MYISLYLHVCVLHSFLPYFCPFFLSFFLSLIFLLFFPELLPSIFTLERGPWVRERREPWTGHQCLLTCNLDFRYAKWSFSKFRDCGQCQSSYKNICVVPPSSTASVCSLPPTVQSMCLWLRNKIA